MHSAYENEFLLVKDIKTMAIMACHDSHLFPSFCIQSPSPGIRFRFQDEGLVYNMVFISATAFSAPGDLLACSDSAGTGYMGY